MWLVPQTFHDELMSKEPVMTALRTKAHELMKNREHVPGMKDVKKQLKQLGKHLSQCGQFCVTTGLWVTTWELHADMLYMPNSVSQPVVDHRH